MNNMKLFGDDDRPDWEKMSNDGMNKFLIFLIFCIFAYGFIYALIELFDKYF